MFQARARLHLFTLSSFAIAQPLYDLIGRHAEFLVAHGAGPWTVAALVVVLSLAVPLVLIAVVEAARRLAPLGGVALHRVVIGALAALIAAGALRQFRPELALAVTLAAGIAATIGYGAPAVRTFVTVLSPAILIFPALFVFGTPVARLVWPERATQSNVALQRQPPIVLVVFDELDTLSLLDRTGGIDAARFPNFAAFARRATWFPNAVAAFPYTSFAIPAITTGVSSDSSRPMLPIAADYPHNLFTWLGQSYPLHVVEPITALCPPAVCTAGRRETDAKALVSDLAVLYLHIVTPRAIAEHRLPSLAFAWKGFGAAPADKNPATPADDWSFVNAFAQAASEGRGELFREFIRGIDAGPKLHFAHVLLPHDPYEYLPSGRRYAPRDTQTAGMTADTVWKGDSTLIETARARHLAQVGFVDALVGELIGHLESLNIFDDALIVLMSDHGAAFQHGQSHRIMNAANYRELVAAPIFVKLPQQRTGGADERRASGLDMVPTIAEVLGATLPWKADGHSILSSDFPARPVLEYQGLNLPALQTFDVRAEARTHMPLSDVLPEEALVGQPMAALDVAPAAAGMQVLSDGFRAFRSVPQDRAFVPALVEGRLERQDGSTEPVRLAVAVNGVVQAVTKTSAWYGTPHYFATFVPETAIRPGANSLEVLVIEGTSPQLRLARLGSDLAGGLALVRGTDGEALQLSDGRRVPLTRDATGFVDRIDEHGDGITLHGWAVDQRGARALRTVVVCGGRTSVAFAYPAAPRADVAAAMHVPPETKVTYSVKVPRAELARGPLRLFGLTFANSAGELQLSSEARQVLARVWEAVRARQ